jgi:phytanoyl-CoA hydroxylase
MPTALDSSAIDTLRSHYLENGYAVVPGVLSAGEVAAYKARATSVVRGDYPEEARKRLMRDVRIAKGLVPTPEDPEDGMWKMLNPDRFDVAFRDFLHTPAILDALEGILGPDLLCFLLMVIYKPKGIESVHPFHQDAYYFPFGPHDDIVGVWAPLDDTHRDNGGLQLVPGSQRGPVKTHETLDPLSNAHAYGIPEAEAAGGAVALEVAAGDAVLFHSRMWHKTESNLTDDHRRVLTLHACSARCAMIEEGDLQEYGMVLTRGQTHPGCLQPQEAPSMELHISEHPSFKPKA